MIMTLDDDDCDDKDDHGDAENKEYDGNTRAILIQLRRWLYPNGWVHLFTVYVHSVICIVDTGSCQISSLIASLDHCIEVVSVSSKLKGARAASWLCFIKSTFLPLIL